MHRASWKVLPVAIAAVAVASFAATAGAHSGKGEGKKPLGTIASFDGTTLTVALTSGETETATVTEDTQIKVEHRGHPVHKKGRDKGQGNPSQGDPEVLTAGSFVLRMKVDEDGNLDKIRVRPATHGGEPSATPTPTAGPTETPAPTETPSPTGTPAPSESPSPAA